MAGPALVVFDCDGVLVDSEPLSMRVLLQTIEAKGVTLDLATAYARFLGRSLASICRDLGETDGITLDEADLEDLRRRLYATFRAELRPTSGIHEAIAGLDRPFCVASSSQPERIELSLRTTGLWTYFEGRAFSATMVARGKPAPDLFEHAARAMGHGPEHCVVVEDSPAGLLAAEAAGMRSIAYVGASHAKSPTHRSALERLAPDIVLDDMRRLPEILKRL